MASKQTEVGLTESSGVVPGGSDGAAVRRRKSPEAIDRVLLDFWKSEALAIDSLLERLARTAGESGTRASAELAVRRLRFARGVAMGDAGGDGSPAPLKDAEPGEPTLAGYLRRTADTMSGDASCLADQHERLKGRMFGYAREIRTAAEALEPLGLAWPECRTQEEADAQPYRLPGRRKTAMPAAVEPEVRAVPKGRRDTDPSWPEEGSPRSHGQNAGHGGPDQRSTGPLVGEHGEENEESGR